MFCTPDGEDERADSDLLFGTDFLRPIFMKKGTSFGQDDMEKKKQAINAAIFDLDGTIIDSEGNHYESDRLLLLRRGIAFTREAKTAYVGKDIHEMVRGVAAAYGLKEDPAELTREKSAIYREIALQSTRLYPPMNALLRGLGERGIPMAVATGSDASIGREILDALGVGHFFSLFVSSSEVTAGKPEPDIFLEAARRMGTTPEGCLVFEDTLYGLEAALWAGMGCVFLPSEPHDGEDLLSRQADYFVPGGADALNTEDFFTWFDGIRSLRQ